MHPCGRSVRRFGGEFCVDQIGVRNALGKFPGFFKDILKQKETVLFKDQVAFPGVLRSIALYDSGDRLKVCLLKLRSDHFGDLGRRVGRHVVHTFLQGVREGLDDFRVTFEIAFLCGEGGIGNVAGAFAQRRHDVAVALGFKGGGVWFEFDSVRSLIRHNQRK